MSTSTIDSAAPQVISGLTTVLKGISQTIFAEYPTLTSFGWKQYVKEGEGFVTTIKKPDIDYEDGAEVYDKIGIAAQEFIYNQLKRLNPTALKLAFEENAEVTVDMDLDITRTEYDTDRINPFEL